MMLGEHIFTFSSEEQSLNADSPMISREAGSFNSISETHIINAEVLIVLVVSENVTVLSDLQF